MRRVMHRRTFILLLAAGLVAAWTPLLPADEPKLQSIPLELPALNRAVDLAFPLRASVPLPKGWLAAGELNRVAIVEAGKTQRLVPAQFEPALSWSDGSVAVLHAPFAVHWDAGVPRKYWLVRSANAVSQPKVTPADAKLLRDVVTAGPLLVDTRGLTFRARWDADLEKNIQEEAGGAVTRVEASGWYQTERRNVAPLAGFWISAERYADTPRIITIDLASTFTDFDQAAICKLGFEMPELPEGTRILTRSFEMKAPFRVDRTEKGFTVWQWPGDATPSNHEDVSLERLAAFACFRESPDGVLADRLPPEYTAALRRVNESGETNESLWNYAAASRLSGVSMHCRFAIVLPDDNAPADDSNTAGVLEPLFEHTPIPLPANGHIAQTGLFGPMAVPGDDFQDVEATVRAGLIGHMEAPSKRYGYKGWHVFGGTFHEEMMQRKRPCYHRVWNNNHYGHTGTLWQAVCRSRLRDRAQLLYWARAATDNLASISLCRYDSQRGYYTGQVTPEGQFQLRNGATVPWRQLGFFMHCKTFLPWGSRTYGDNWSDADGGRNGHLAHAHNLLFAWLFDGDRWSRRGYDLWLTHMQFPTGGDLKQVRQTNQTLLEAIWAHRYSRRPDIIPAIHGMADRLTSIPLVEQLDAPLWAPAWPAETLELYQEDPALDPDGTRQTRLKQWIIDNAESAGQQVWFSWTMALCAKACELTGDAKYLARHADTIDRTCRRLCRGSYFWNGYGLGPLTGDCHMIRQWPRFLWALRQAKIEKLTPVGEPGWYLVARTRFDNAGDIAARGTEILIAKGEATAPLQIDTNARHAASLRAFDPAGNLLWEEPRIKEERKNRVKRPSSWVANRTSRELTGPAGIYRLKVGAHELGLFQGLAGGLPECQILQNSRIADWNEPVVYAVQVSRGWLVRTAGSSPIKLRWKGVGERDASHVVIESAGAPVWDRWLPNDASDEAVLTGPGPWKLDVFGEGTAMATVEIDTSLPRPLLYGADLEEIRNFTQR